MRSVSEKVAEQIEGQFPAQLPPDDYQFEFIFGVKLDYRDWRVVLAALSAPQEGMVCVPKKKYDLNDAPSWYNSEEASAWLSGHNAAVDAMLAAHQPTEKASNPARGRRNE